MMVEEGSIKIVNMALGERVVPGHGHISSIVKIHYFF